MKVLLALALCLTAVTVQAETMTITSTMCNVALTSCTLISDDPDVVSLAFSPSTTKLSEVENDANGVGVLTEQVGALIYDTTTGNNYHKATPFTVTYNSGDVLTGIRTANRSGSGRGGYQWHYAVSVMSIESPSEAQ